MGISAIRGRSEIHQRDPQKRTPVLGNKVLQELKRMIEETKKEAPIQGLG